MSKPTLYDNDVVLKISAYEFWDLLSQYPLFSPAAILAVATYSLPAQAARIGRVANRDHLNQVLSSFLSSATIIEPTSDELELASSLEEQAIQASVALDSGESQLVAVLLARGFDLAATGDKRALQALHDLGLPGLDGRLICLEQILLALLNETDHEPMRVAVCAEAKMDTAVTIAFGCKADHYSKADVIAGLESYVSYLRNQTGELLIA